MKNENNPSRQKAFRIEENILRLNNKIWDKILQNYFKIAKHHRIYIYIYIRMFHETLKFLTANNKDEPVKHIFTVVLIKRSILKSNRNSPSMQIYHSFSTQNST